MDAAHTFRKFALFFAVALLCAGAAFAGVTASPTDVTVPNTGSTSFAVNSGTPGAAYTASINWNGGTVHFFLLTGAPGNTPGTIALSRQFSCNFGLSTCPDATITITGDGGTATVTVHDSVSSGGGGGGGGTTSVTANPTQANLTASNGGVSSLVSVAITNNTSSSQALDINSSVAWLSAFPSGPQAITIGANSTLTIYVSGNAVGYSNQTLNGNVTLSNSSIGTLTIPVQFTVGTGGSGGSTGSITASPTSLTFSYPNSSVQVVNVSSNTATAFTASTTASWLQVGQTSGSIGTASTPIYVSINPTFAASLPNGVANASVVLTPNVGNATVIPVALYVNTSGGGGTVSGGVAPTTLNFSYQLGAAGPLPQTVYIGGTDSYTISQSGRFFANLGTIQAPGTFTVQPTVFNVSAGTENGSVILTSNSSGVSQTIPASMLVSSSPVIVANVNNLSLGDIVCAVATGCTVSVTVTSSDNSNLPLTISSSNSWIVVTNAPTGTPGSFTVQLVPTGLSGLNTGSITVSATGAANNLVIPVVLALAGTSGGGGSGGPLTLSTTSLNFTAAGQQQQIAVSANTITQFTAALGASGCNWLNMTYTGFTPGTITLTSALNPGTPTTCTLTLGAGGQTQTVTLTFNGGSGGGTGTGTLTPSSTTVNLTAQFGQAATAQTIQLTGSGGTISFTATPYVVGQSNPWVTVSPSTGTVTGTTPATLTVGANTAGLQPGTYTGYIQISNTTSQITVNLTISAATTVSATPATLTFNYSAGGATPAPQSIQVTGVAANLPFSATVTSGTDWLSVTPTSGTAGTTATNLSVSVDPTKLAANKSYTGTIVVAGTGSATGSTTITVTLNISAPLPTISRVTNAASFNGGAISAGEIITIFGTAIGPQTLQVASPSNNLYPNELAGVQVTVGGVLAPLIYVRSDQISAIVPYEINRPVFLANVAVVVHFLGQGSNGVNLQQASAAPGVFTTGGGTGQAAALNSNLSVNSTANPANKGDVIVLYVTGEGQTSPAGVTGRVTSNATTFPISGQVTVTIDGVPAAIEYAGEAPGLVSGVMQVNARIPAGLTNSGSLPVVVSVGGIASQVDARGIGTATIAVR